MMWEHSGDLDYEYEKMAFPGDAMGNLKVREFETKNSNDLLPIPIAASSLTKFKFDARIMAASTDLKLTFCGISKDENAKHDSLNDQVTRLVCPSTATAEELSTQQQKCLDIDIPDNSVTDVGFNTFMILVKEDIEIFNKNQNSRWVILSQVDNWRSLSSHDITQITSVGVSSNKHVKWKIFTSNENMCDPDDCVNKTSCQNGSQCIDGINSYFCNCLDGFEGEFCQINIDECNLRNVGNPCQNGAVCADGVNSYTCNCPAGYEGNRCQISTGNWVRYPGNDVNSAYGSALPYSGSTTSLYYTINTSSKDSWTSCRDTICPGLGGTFASITSKYEQQFFVSSYFQDKFSDADYEKVFLGGYDTSSTNGQFRWLYGASSNDELADTSFVTWNLSSDPDANYNYLVQFRSGTDLGKWYDYTIEYDRHCLCQRRYRNSDNTNDCSVNPCENGASCTDGVDSYTCNCVAGYEGTLCQEKLL